MHWIKWYCHILSLAVTPQEVCQRSYNSEKRKKLQFNWPLLRAFIEHCLTTVIKMVRQLDKTTHDVIIKTIQAIQSYWTSLHSQTCNERSATGVKKYGFHEQLAANNNTHMD